MTGIKEKLYKICLEDIQDRISSAELAITSAKEAAGNETKSSAGDKYETSREMLQQEINLNQRQLAAARKLKHDFSNINPSKICTVAEQGSLVFTDKGIFFIAAGLGPVLLESTQFQVISAASPIARAFLGHKEKDVIIFNGTEFNITSVQ